MKVITSLVVVFITLPIWFYTLFWVLTKLNTPDLIWFLFWVYVPFSLFSFFLFLLF